MIKHDVVAITASAQRLSTALGITANDEGDRVRWVQFQPAGANANPVFFGGVGVTTSDFGFSLPAGSGGVPPAPYVPPEGHPCTRLSDWYFVGTASQNLAVAWEPM